MNTWSFPILSLLLLVIAALLTSMTATFAPGTRSDRPTKYSGSTRKHKLYHMSFCFNREKKNDRYALWYFHKACALRPNDARMWVALGGCFEKTG
jgi:hypothetical protein